MARYYVKGEKITASSHICFSMGRRIKSSPIPKPAYRSLIRYLIRCFLRLQLSA